MTPEIANFDTNLTIDHTEMTVKAALFDLDGVLVDSERLYTRFYTRLGLDYGIPDPDFALNIKGSTIEQILSRFFPTPEAQADVLDRISRFEDSMDYPLMPGVMEFLEALRNEGVMIAIVTSSSVAKMEKLGAVRPQLLAMADTIVTGDDVTHSKPDPEGYLLAAGRLGAPIAECYVFEDSLSGLQAGIDSGATVIGLSTTLPASRLAGKAHAIIDGFEGFTTEMMRAVSRP